MLLTVLVAVTGQRAGFAEPPSVVVVRAALPGARAEVIEAEVTVPLERALAGLPRVRAVKSRSDDGVSVLEVHFDGHAGAQELALVERRARDVQAVLPSAAVILRVAVETPSLL